MTTQVANKILFLMGPTTAGKTALAIKLHKIFKSRIISVDSALIYKNMNIGTAKPSPTILKKYPHHLIDICNPEETYSAYDFKRDATVQIKSAFANNEIAILTGGTSFYFNALEHGLSNLPESNVQSKHKFNQLLQQKGVVALHQKLQKIDAKAADRIHSNDAQRIIRALEVFDLSGKTISELQNNKQCSLNYPIQKIILMPNRSILHERIKVRFIDMIKQGLIDEVKTLRQNTKLNQQLPSMRCVGYRQVWQYLDGDINKQQMIEKAIIATRQLCKRQSTWLNSETNRLLLTKVDTDKAVDFINHSS